MKTETLLGVAAVIGAYLLYRAYTNPTPGAWERPMSDEEMRRWLLTQ